MPQQRPHIPEGHGEVVARPAIGAWADLARESADTIASWRFAVGGRDVTELRADARRVLTAHAREYTSSLGITDPPAGKSDLVVVTGHQPEIFHTGVWAKYFMMQRVIAETGATGLDLVLDSDTFTSVSLALPCFAPAATRCTSRLVPESDERCYAGAPVPSRDEIEAFRSAGSSALESLTAPSVKRHFESFCDVLPRAAESASDLAGFVTSARRRYEGDLTGYLELPVTGVARTRPYFAYVADIICGAARFADCYNIELAEFRETHKIRSAAQPFPDLEVGPRGVELPFWLIVEGCRQRVFARDVDGGIEIVADTMRSTMPAAPEPLADALASSGILLAPRAVTLTLFARMLLADLFVHGVGGAHYDRVTDGVAKRYWGVTLPSFAVGSLTMRLPLGAHAVDAEEVAGLDRTLKRLTHNPDEFLGEVEFDDAEQETLAHQLAAEKRDLIARIDTEGADRKALGARIKEVNTSLATMLAPVVAEVTAQRALRAAQLDAAEVLTDRTYPLCLWSPAQVADKVW